MHNDVLLIFSRLYNSDLTKLPSEEPPSQNQVIEEPVTPKPLDVEPPEKDCEIGEAEDAHTNTETTIFSLPSYCKNLMGVDILPDIPEEDEVEEEDIIDCKENIQIGLKRFSTISAQFEDLISNENQNAYCVLGPSFLSEIDRTFWRNNRGENSSFLRDAWSNYGCCSPYQKYVCKKKMRSSADFLCENLLKPLFCALRSSSFYPSLLTKLTTTFTSTVFVVVIPYLSVVNGTEQFLHIISSESALLLTLVSFGWLCFLIFLPWIVNARKTKLKVLFLVGLACLGGSFFGKCFCFTYKKNFFILESCFNCWYLFLVLKYQLNHDVITISCLLFGLGFGMIGCTEDSFYREVIGIRHWKAIDGPLEVLSGFFVILIYYVIYEDRADITFLLAIYYSFYVFLVLMWIFWHLVGPIGDLIMRVCVNQKLDE